MLGLFKKKIDNNIYSPVNGTCISLELVNDNVFASKMMGEGVAFQFEEEILYAPCDATVTLVAETKHAIGLMGNNGLEILIHIGLNTVALEGKGFEVLINKDDKVKCGDPLIKVDQIYMKEKNIDLTTPMIITNNSEHEVEVLKVENPVLKGTDAVLKKKD